MFSFITPVFSFLFDSLFNAHTYVGVFLGACFSPLWVKIWSYVSAKIVALFPKAAPVITEVDNVAAAVVADITPVANAVDAVVTPAKVLPAGTVTKASK
jgi:hypothetical protein